jgi:hypothetical protein
MWEEYDGVREGIDIVGVASGNGWLFGEIEIDIRGLCES